MSYIVSLSDSWTNGSGPFSFDVLTSSGGDISEAHIHINPTCKATNLFTVDSGRTYKLTTVMANKSASVKLELAMGGVPVLMLDVDIPNGTSSYTWTSNGSEDRLLITAYMGPDTFDCTFDLICIGYKVPTPSVSILLSPGATYYETTPVVYTFAGASVGISLSPTNVVAIDHARSGSVTISLLPDSDYRKGNEWAGNVGIDLTPESLISEVSLSWQGSLPLALTPRFERVVDFIRDADFPFSLSIASPIAFVSSTYEVWMGDLGINVGQSSTVVIRKRSAADPVVKAGCPQCGTLMYN